MGPASQRTAHLPKVVTSPQKGAITEIQVQPQFGYHEVEPEDIHTAKIRRWKQQRKLTAFRKQPMHKATIQ